MGQGQGQNGNALQGSGRSHKVPGHVGPNSCGCIQANLNFEKIVVSHCWVLNAQNSKKNMPNMIPIMYLNDNLMDYNENWHGVNENPSFTPMCFGTQQKVRKQSKTHFTLFSCRYHNF